MKNFYIVFAVDGNRAPALYKGIAGTNKKYFADVMCVSDLDNLAARLECIGGLLSANICSTKKQAREIADAWNEGYKKNGTYLFG